MEKQTVENRPTKDPFSSRHSLVSVDSSQAIAKKYMLVLIFLFCFFVEQKMSGGTSLLGEALPREVVRGRGG
jgi:hypothetical protein